MDQFFGFNTTSFETEIKNFFISNTEQHAPLFGHLDRGCQGIGMLS